MHSRHYTAIISTILSLAFTAYIASDTFLISHVYTTVDTDQMSETDTQQAQALEAPVESSGTSSEPAESASEATVTDSSYVDDNIQITISTYREQDTDIYVADIQLSDPQYLKTALAQASYGKNVTDTTSNIAADNDAILAINGDYYGVQEAGYVIRNGVLYRDAAKEDQEDLVIYEDGTMTIINEEDISAQELLDQGAYNVLCFGPGLIENGDIAVTTTDEVAKAMTSNPRTAIGIIDELHYVFVVADGRTSASEGLTLYQLAEFMQSLGVTTGYNLDGGGSSTMVFNGTIINNPTSGHSGGKHSHSSTSTDSERSVSDIVYIGY